MTKCKVSLWDLNSVTLDFGQFIRSIHRNSEVQTMQHYAIQMQYFLMKWPKVTKPNPDLWLKRGWGLFLWKYFNFIPCPTLTIFIKTKVTWDGGLTKNGRNQVVVDVLVYLINGNLFSFFFLVFLFTYVQLENSLCMLLHSTLFVATLLCAGGLQFGPLVVSSWVSFFTLFPLNRI